MICAHGCQVPSAGRAGRARRSEAGASARTEMRMMTRKNVVQRINTMENRMESGAAVNA
jgi:hypothetical protein